jgi:hypothetical protein
MKPLFEIPELLTLSGEKFSGTLGVMGNGEGCQNGCDDGCSDGCVTGTGSGKSPGPIPLPRI